MLKKTFHLIGKFQIHKKCLISTANEIVNCYSDLNLKMAKKYIVHRLFQGHIYERRKCCKNLYEKHLSGEKKKNVLTIGVAWVYSSDYNRKRAIYYHKRGGKILLHVSENQKEVFLKDL